MKTNIIVFAAVLSLGILALNNPVHAEEKGFDKGSMMEDKGSHKSLADGDITAKVTESGAIKVGNTICPLSKEKVGEMGEIIEYEHEGKIYNLCCKMCARDFKKDPEKYIKLINDSMADEGTVKNSKVKKNHKNHNH